MRFRFKEDSVIDLVKILESRRGLPLAPSQQVLIALRFYATGTIGDLFGVSVFVACTVIHKVSRAIAKRKGHFLSFPDNLTDTKRTFYDAAHFPGVTRAIDCTHIRILHVPAKKVLWHLLIKSSFTPSTYKPFVITMPSLLTSWHAGLDRLTHF